MWTSGMYRSLREDGYSLAIVKVLVSPFSRSVSDFLGIPHDAEDDLLEDYIDGASGGHATAKPKWEDRGVLLANSAFLGVLEKSKKKKDEVDEGTVLYRPSPSSMIFNHFNFLTELINYSVVMFKYDIIKTNSNLCLSLSIHFGLCEHLEKEMHHNADYYHLL